MRTICIAMLAAGLTLPVPAAAFPFHSKPVFAQATQADQPAPKKKKAKRKPAPKVEYMRAVPSR